MKTHMFDPRTISLPRGAAWCGHEAGPQVAVSEMDKVDCVPCLKRYRDHYEAQADRARRRIDDLVYRGMRERQAEIARITHTEEELRELREAHLAAIAQIRDDMFAQIERKLGELSRPSPTPDYPGQREHPGGDAEAHTDRKEPGSW